MNVKIRNNILFLTTLVFCFLSYWGIGTQAFVVPFYFVFLGIFLFINVFFAFRPTMQKILAFSKTASAKYYFLFVFGVVLSIILSLIHGRFDSKGFLTTFLGNFVFSQFFMFLTMLIALPHLVSYKKLSKFLLLVYLGIFLLAIVEFAGDIFNISLIQSFFSILVNKRAGLGVERYVIQAFGLPRVSSVFQEPSYFAGFIVCSSPLIYKLCFSKEQFFKNFMRDIFVKKITFGLMIISLLLTQSPIFIIFAVIIGLIAILKSHLRIKKRFMIPVLYAIAAVALSTSILYLFGVNMFENFNLTETFLVRVLKTVPNLLNMNVLAFVEPALASRLGNFAAQFSIFKSHPLFGIGYGNINLFWSNAVLDLPFTITPELYMVALRGSQKCGASMLFKYLSETGIFATFFLYLFLTNLLYSAKKKIKYFEGIEKDLILGLFYTVLVIALTSFYDTFAYMGILWLYIGMLQSMMLYKK